MINVKILKEDAMGILEDGYILEEEENSLIIRNAKGKSLVQIMVFEDQEDVLISDKDKFAWVSEIKSIVSVFREKLFVFYSSNDKECEFIVDNN